MMCRTKWRNALLAVMALLATAPAARALHILIADDLFSGNPDESLGFLVNALAPDHNVTYDQPNTDTRNLPTLTSNLEYLRNFDAVIFYKSGIDNAGRLLSPGEYDALYSYVADYGGNLVIAGPNLLVTPDGVDTLTQDLIASAIAGGTLDADFYETPNEDDFVLNGPWGDVRNLSISMPELTTHDRMLADDSVGAYGEAYVGYSDYDKIIFSYFDGINSGILAWTGNWFGDDWYPISSGNPGLTLLRNFLVDDDRDGVLDGIDNCPDTYNPNQADSVGNGVGDACRPQNPPPPPPADRPLTIRCGAGAAQAALPILLGLGLMKLGTGRARRSGQSG